MYKVLRPMFDPNRYAREVLQIKSLIKHINMVKDYQVDCKYEFESQDHAFSRFIVGQVNFYQIDIDVEGIQEEGKNMYSNTYLTKLRGLPINSKPYEDVAKEIDVMVSQIVKRTRKWVKWIEK